MTTSKALIFDLGGVIIDVDVPETLRQFAALSGRTGDEIYDLYRSTSAFNDFEKGLIDASQFRRTVRALLDVPAASDQQLNDAWNAMIRSIPLEKIELLKRLKESYEVFILSNTNDLHVDYVNHTILPPLKSVRSFDECVHHVYYSHLMKMRKPDEEIFQYLLDAHNLDPSDTVFLDDNEENIAAATRLGMTGTLVTHPDMVFELFA